MASLRPLCPRKVNLIVLKVFLAILIIFNLLIWKIERDQRRGVRRLNKMLREWEAKNAEQENGDLPEVR